ncbi:MAG: hypothetical protein JWL64_758 [Frankiales bacterium]|nr:hypothetical protein [Frankiales bacterium]MCW2667980.1 hypothetical protein [Frankiales bacterium]
MSALQDIRRDYRAALLRYLPRREEAALHLGYEIGRAAVREGVGLLVLAQLHHEVFLTILQDTPGGEVTHVATSASEFLLEVLAPYDMTSRAFLDGQP